MAGGLSKQDALDAVWKRHLSLSKLKIEKEMRPLVKKTLILIGQVQVDGWRSFDPFAQSLYTAQQYWVANVFDPVG